MTYRFKKAITLVIPLLLWANLNLIAQNQSDSNFDTNSRINLKNHVDSVSYSYGYFQAKQMKKSGMDDLDPEIIAKTMGQVWAGESPLIPEKETLSILGERQKQARQKRKKRLEEQAFKNEKKGQVFLEKNKTNPGVKTTKTGLQFKILKEGSGASPLAKDTVVVNYTGELLNGEIFDQNNSTPIPLNHVIRGWQEGIQLMKEGATYKFWIPGSLGYGRNPRPGGPIGPNELLVFTVKLLKVKK